jgi:hypothetical protein
MAASHSSTPFDPLRLLPILLWLAVQLGALAVAAGGVPLWAHHPLPHTSLACDVVVAAQVAAISLLFPVVLRDLSMSLVAIAATWPFLLLAGMLASEQQDHLLLAMGYLALWMGALAWLSQQLAIRAARLAAVCASAVLVIGPLILRYLSMESRGSTGDHNWLAIARASPIAVGLSMLRDGRPSWSSLLPITAVAIAAGLLRAREPKSSPSASSTSLHHSQNS